MNILAFDLETTGLSKEKDQIIQIAIIVFDTNTNNIVKSYSSYVQPIGNYSISLAGYFKHQITPKFLSDKPYLKDIAPDIVRLFDENDNILTYNGDNFDIPFLSYELQKYGYNIDFTKKHCYDAFVEERRRNGTNLDSVFHRYKGQTMEEFGLVAHNAFSDVKATYEVFTNQQNNKPYKPENIYSNDNVIIDEEFLEKIQPCFNIGKYKHIGISWVAKNDQNYLKWCISDKCSFSDQIKKYISQYIV